MKFFRTKTISAGSFAITPSSLLPAFLSLPPLWAIVLPVGAYLPVLCDKILMTKGSGLYLAGPSLVKAAIGQIVDAEELAARKCTRKLAGPLIFMKRTTRRV
jgi:hypothetical protein